MHEEEPLGADETTTMSNPPKRGETDNEVRWLQDEASKKGMTMDRPHRPISQIKFSPGAPQKERGHYDGASRKETTSADTTAASQYKDWESDVPQRSPFVSPPAAEPRDPPTTIAPPTARAAALHPDHRLYKLLYRRQQALLMARRRRMWEEEYFNAPDILFNFYKEACAT